MYLSFYGLKKPPFNISPDPDFLWFSPKHRQAFSALKYAIIEEKGFLALIGDVGTGKTLLIKHLINDIGVPAIIVAVADPDMNTFDFFTCLAEEAKMEKEFQSKGEFLVHFKQFLLEAYGSDKKVLLIIDEAQRLNFELLEQIRLLSNIAVNNKQLLNIFFVGQIEFELMLMDEKGKSTRQRIVVRHWLEPLDESETALYIKHRLKVAGTNKEIFSSGAIQEIYSLSNGFPRIINIICDNALRVAYGAELETITRDFIEENIIDLYIPDKIEPIKKEKPNLIQAHEKKATQVLEPTQLKEKPYRKAPIYFKNMMILVIFLFLAFAGYHIYDSNTANLSRWKAQDIAPKEKFGLSEAEQEEIKSKSSYQIERGPAKGKLPDAESMDQDKVISKKLIARVLPEDMEAAEAGEEKEAIIKALEAIEPIEVQIKEPSTSRVNTDKEINEKLIAAAFPETAEIAEFGEERKAEIKSFEPNKTQIDQIKEPSASPVNNEENVNKDPIARTLSKVTEVDESGEKKQAKKKFLDLNKTQEDKQKKPSALVVGSIDKHVEDATFDERIAELDEKASLLESQLISGGKGTIYFKHNSFELPEQSQKTLIIVLGILSIYPQSNIIIEGYTDSKGDPLYNEYLSQSRADVIQTHLLNKGISPSRIKAKGMGSQNPIGNNETLKGRRQNRRVEIKLKM